MEKYTNLVSIFTSIKLHGGIFCDFTSASPTDTIPGRQYKKLHSKEYSLRNANCQHAADDIAYNITEGRSLLAPAPCRRIPEVILDACEDQGVKRTILKAKRATRHLASHHSSPQAAVTGAMHRMYNAADAYDRNSGARMPRRQNHHTYYADSDETEDIGMDDDASFDSMSTMFEDMMYDMNRLRKSTWGSSLRSW